MSRDELPNYPFFHSLEPDEEVTLEAIPGFNYRFDYWGQDNFKTNSSEVYATSRQITVAAGADWWLTAHFSQIVPTWLMIVIVASVTTALAVRWYLRRRQLA